MKAITYEEFGDLDILALSEVPDPKVGPGEVLIRVRSASVNPVDWKIVGGYLDPMMNVELPAIPGWDVSGVVEKVGFDTPEFEVGDDVDAVRGQLAHALGQPVAIRQGLGAELA